MLGNLTGVVAKRGHRRYFARCLELELDCEGTTEEEARNNLINAVQRHIDNLCETREPGMFVCQRPKDDKWLAPVDGKVFEMPNYLILH